MGSFSKNTLTRTGSTKSNQASGLPRISKDLSRKSGRKSKASGHHDEHAAYLKNLAASRTPAGQAAGAHHTTAHHGLAHHGVAHHGLAHHGSGHHGLKKPPLHVDVEERLREEVAIRKKEELRHAEMLAKEEEDLQKFEALHKQLRGKEYGYDHKGQVSFSQPKSF